MGQCGVAYIVVHLNQITTLINYGPNNETQLYSEWLYCEAVLNIHQADNITGTVHAIEPGKNLCILTIGTPLNMLKLFAVFQMFCHSLQLLKQLKTCEKIRCCCLRY